MKYGIVGIFGTPQPPVTLTFRGLYTPPFFSTLKTRKYCENFKIFSQIWLKVAGKFEIFDKRKLKFSLESDNNCGKIENFM